MKRRLRIDWTLRGLLLLACAAAAQGCKDIGDYLVDLNTVHDPKSYDHLLAAYDAGQLCHEALTGIAEEDVLNLNQMGRALAFAAEIIQRDKSNLSRADAAMLIGHIVARFPVPPRDRPYEYTNDVETLVKEQIGILSQEENYLAIETTILPSLESPDPVVVQDALDALRRLANNQPAPGESAPSPKPPAGPGDGTAALNVDFGNDKDKWRQWWAGQREARLAEAKEKSREPIRVLGEIRYTRLQSARAVLKYLSLQLALYPFPEIVPIFREAILSVARQTAVFALIFGLERRELDAKIRMDVAEAVGRVRDPAFAKPLADALIRESDPDVRVKLIQAAASYPSRALIESLIRTVGRIEEPSAALNASLTLEALTGERFGTEARLWEAWWEAEGQARYR